MLVKESSSYNAKAACIGDKLCKVYITGKKSRSMFLYTLHTPRGELGGLAREDTSNSAVGVRVYLFYTVSICTELKKGRGC